jgi:hypothetical protein
MKAACLTMRQSAAAAAAAAAAEAAAVNMKVTTACRNMRQQQLHRKGLAMAVYSCRLQ